MYNKILQINNVNKTSKRLKNDVDIENQRIIQTERPLTTRIFTPIGLWTKAAYNKNRLMWNHVKYRSINAANARYNVQKIPPTSRSLSDCLVWQLFTKYSKMLWYWNIRFLKAFHIFFWHAKTDFCKLYQCRESLGQR